MKTEVYLVRHGETEWNKLGKFQGCIDINLSDEGVLQAATVKEALRDKFDFMYVSPLKRAVQTATIICEDTNIKPDIEDDLREINFGKWEGLTFNQIKEQYPEEFNIWRTDEIDGAIMGGDLTLKKASERAEKAITSLVNKHKGKRIAIVAHGGIIKAGLIGLFGWKMTMYHRFYIGNTAITHLEFEDNHSPILITLNDMNHVTKQLSFV